MGHLLEYRAGPRAMELLRREGLPPERVRAVAGPASGPRWLALAGIDRALMESGLAAADGSAPRLLVGATAPHLPADKPRYLMGVGAPADLVEAVDRGIDFFGCVLPTLNARNGALFAAAGTLNIRNAAHAADPGPVEPCKASIGMAMLAIVNYLEHSGLERREIAPGRYEPVKPWHSWDSYHRVTNFFLINLGRHSDHHMKADRPYQILRHHSDAGQLPYGYVTLLIMVLIPPLWFKVMNPRARALRALGGNPIS